MIRRPLPSSRARILRCRTATGTLAPGWRWYCLWCGSWNAVGVCTTREEALTELEAHVTRRTNNSIRSEEAR